MADIRMGNLIYTVGLDRASLQQAINQTKSLDNNMSRALQNSGRSAKKAANEYDMLNRRALNVRTAFQAGQISAEQFENGMREIIGTASALRQKLLQMESATEMTSQEMYELQLNIGKVARAGRTAQSSLDSASGRISRLGLASQVSLGATTLLNDQFFRMSPALGILTGRLQQAAGGFKAFIRQAALIVGIASIILGIAAAIRQATRAGIEMEDAMADVRKTTNLVGRDMDRLVGSFQDLSQELPNSATELMDIAAVAGQLGIRGVSNIRDFTETIAQLSLATDVVGEEGATSLARFLQATGTSVDQMGTAAKETGSVLNELENTTAATASEILQMTRYTAALSSQANASRTDILAYNSALLSLGIRAEAGGSALVRMFGDIQTAATEGGDVLGEYAEVAGMTVQEFQTLVKESPADALQEFIGGLSRAKEGGADLNAILNDLGITEIRQRNATLALASGYDVLNTARETANEEAETQTSLEREVEIQLGKVSAQLKILGNNFNVLFQVGGKTIVPLLANILSLVNAVVGGLADFAQRLNSTPSENYRREVEGLASAFDNVKDTDDLLQALDDVGAKLQGPAKDAWDKYAQKVRDTKGDIEDVTTVAKEAIAELLSIAATGPRVAVDVANRELERAVQMAGTFGSGLTDEEIRIIESGFGGGPLSLENSLGTVREGILADPDRRTRASGQAALSKIVAIEEATRQLIRADRDLNAVLAERDAILQDLYGERGDGTATPDDPTDPYDPGAGGGSTEKKNPVESITDSLIQSKGALGILYNELGEMSAVEYFAGMQEATQRARDALLQVLADPNIDDAIKSEARALLTAVQANLDKWDAIVAESEFAELTGPGEGPERTEVQDARDAERAVDNELAWRGRNQLGEFRSARREEARLAEEAQNERMQRAIRGAEAERREIERGGRRAREEYEDQLDMRAHLEEQAQNERMARAERGARAERLAVQRGGEKAYQEHLDMREREERARERESEQRVADVRAEVEREQEIRDRAAEKRYQGIVQAREMAEAHGEEVGSLNEVAWAVGEYRDAVADFNPLLDDHIEVSDEVLAIIRASEFAWLAEAEAIRETEAALRSQAKARAGQESRAHQEDVTNNILGGDPGNDRSTVVNVERIQAAREAQQEYNKTVGDALIRMELFGEKLDMTSIKKEALRVQILALLAEGWEPTSDKVQGLVEQFNDLGGDVLGNVTKAFDQVTSIVSNLGKAFGDSEMGSYNQELQDLVGNIGEAGASIAEMIPGGQAVAGVIRTVTSVVQGLLSVIGDLGNGLAEIDTKMSDMAKTNKMLTEETLNYFADLNTERVSRGGILGWFGFTKAQLTEEFQEWVDIAEGVLGGIGGAMKAAINQAVSDDDDWAENLKKSLKQAILDAIIEAFIQQAIIASYMQDFIAVFVQKLKKDGVDRAAEWAGQNFPKVMEEIEGAVDAFVGALPEELTKGMDEDAGGGGGSGDRGGSVTVLDGAARDLFTDLLRPLAYLPSLMALWSDIAQRVFAPQIGHLERIADNTSAIRDILANARVVTSEPVAIRPPRRQTASSYSAMSAMSGQVYQIDTIHINTRNGDAKSIFRSLSRYVNRETRGGK